MKAASAGWTCIERRVRQEKALTLYRLILFTLGSLATWGSPDAFRLAFVTRELFCFSLLFSDWSLVFKDLPACCLGNTLSTALAAKVKVTEQRNSTAEIMKVIRFLIRSPFTDRNLPFGASSSTASVVSGVGLVHYTIMWQGNSTPMGMDIKYKVLSADDWK